MNQNPLFYLILPLLAVPFFAAALWRRVWPTGRLCAALSVPILFSFLFFLVDLESWLPLVAALDLALAGGALVDFFTLPSEKKIHIERKTDRIASLAIRQTVELTIENRSKRPILLAGVDDSPENIVPEPEHRVSLRTLGAETAETIHYRFLPIRRGACAMEAVWLELFGRLGFWKKTVKYPVFSEIRVYPNLRQLRQYELLARTERLHQMGLRRIRRIGSENDFERLRDYTPDDQYKFIDWASTARKNRLIVREFQQTRNQRLLFMIDAGRMMTAKIGDGSLLDYSFNAMLMLAYIALKNGDSVGALIFSDTVRCFVPPKGGMRQIHGLMSGCFDIFPEQVESRYDKAFSYVSSECRKRSLLIFISNLNDSRNARTAEDYLTRNVGRHLPLAVFLRDRTLFDRRRAGEELLAQAERERAAAARGKGDRTFSLYDDPARRSLLFSSAGAAEIIDRRERVFAELAAKGPLVLDCFPEQMTAPLINKYLEIKAKQLL